MKYHINKNGKVIGPGTIEEMRSLLACHFLLPEDLIRRDGETNWQAISVLTEFGGSVGPQSGSVFTAAAQQAFRPPPEAGSVSLDGQESVSPPDLTGHEITKKTRIRLIQRITPTVYASWALALCIIWTLGYFLAVKLIEQEEQALSRALKEPTRESVVAASAETYPQLAPKIPARPALAPANEPRLQFQYQPANRSFSPHPIPRFYAPLPPPDEAPIFEAHLMPPGPGSSARQNSGDGPIYARNIPFRNYDVNFVQMIRKRWFAILDEQDFVRGKTGRVRVQFRLSPNGRVSNVQTIKNELNDLLAWLCQKAVLEGEPYGLWPTSMRLQVPEGYRLIRFTFYYE